jgi:gentisate 1,2-dioxygenase
VWLDVLDISLMKSLEATFFEPYAGGLQPVSSVPDRSWRQFGSGLMSPPDVAVAPGTNPLLAYPWAVAEQALQSMSGLPADPYDDVVLEYRNPVDGSAAMRTLSMQLQLLRPGFSGRRRRHTGSKLYYVVRGQGRTSVGEEIFEWRPGDFMAVAPWAWHRHENRGAGDALLWQVNDLPTLKALDYFREERE